MRARLFTMALTAVLVVVIACAESTDPAIPPAPTATATPESEPIEYTQKLSGRGDAVEMVHLRPGVSLFETRHTGARNFVMWLKGSTDELLVNVIGAYAGTTVAAVSGGDFLLDVQADGAWTITVREPRNPRPASVSLFRGSGDGVTGFVELRSGLHVVEVAHRGTRNVIVWFRDEEGQTLDLIVNDIGAYEGAQAVRVTRSGLFFLSIQADGDWVVSVE